MAVPDRQQLESALAGLTDPVLGEDLTALGALEPVIGSDGQVIVRVTLGYPAAGLCEGLEAAIRSRIAALAVAVNVEWRWEIPSHRANKTDAIASVKNIIAVASGKGGVGKSTTAVNLALALAVEGARVGLLDADIYGPSQQQMLGVGRRAPQVIDNRYMLPIEAHGIVSNSMGYLVTEQTPMVWRGPMVSSAFQQLINQTRWGELDYLIVDMPPGTGDIQLTLSQTVPVAGAVIVTTPQDIALLDAKKGIEMFRKVNVPVLGIVENMALHVCSHCGHQEHIFGRGGGERIARDYRTDLLGSLPLNISIREQADGGKPSVVNDPDSTVSLLYRDIARRTAARLWALSREAAAMPEIVITDD